MRSDPTLCSHRDGGRFRSARLAVLAAATASLIAGIPTGCANRPSASERHDAASEAIRTTDAPEQPATLQIPAGSYAAAFDGAVEVVRSLGFEPHLLDRRAGLIEAGPARSATILEPWEKAISDPLESTLHLQRRLVRVQFEPLGIRPQMDSDLDPLQGPITDLTRDPQPLRMLVTVVVQRQQKPFEHRASWSLAARSEAWAYDPATGEQRPATWRAIRRDPDLEKRIAARCLRRLGSS